MGYVIVSLVFLVIGLGAGGYLHYRFGSGVVRSAAAVKDAFRSGR